MDVMHIVPVLLVHYSYTGEYCRIQNQKDEGDSGYKSLLDTRVLDVKDPLHTQRLILFNSCH